MPERKKPQPPQGPPILPEQTGDSALDSLLYIKHRLDTWEHESQQPLPEIVVPGLERPDERPFLVPPPPRYTEPLTTMPKLNRAAWNLVAVGGTATLLLLGYQVTQVLPKPVPIEAAATLPPQAPPEKSAESETDQRRPSGNPLKNPNTVITQGYGVGSHAPAEIWGGVDLAIDADGDGKADPTASQGAPVYASHAGVVEVKPDSYPGGNCILLRTEGYRTTYCHLSGFSVEDGAEVSKGQQIATVGSTGNSSGPHLHYEVWVNGVNKNPLDFGAGEDS